MLLPPIEDRGGHISAVPSYGPDHRMRRDPDRIIFRYAATCTTHTPSMSDLRVMAEAISESAIATPAETRAKLDPKDSGRVKV